MQNWLGWTFRKSFLRRFELINKGRIAEVFAGLELIKSGGFYQKFPLYFWQREEKSGNAEVDFVIQLKNEMLPIEVKSGTKGSMQSIRYFIEQKNIEKGLRFSLENFSEFENIKVIHSLCNFKFIC